MIDNGYLYSIDDRTIKVTTLLQMRISPAGLSAIVMLVIERQCLRSFPLGLLHDNSAFYVARAWS